MKNGFFAMLSVVLAVGVGGCATTMGPATPQLVSVGPVSGACPQCGQGITVPANGAVMCPHCGGNVRLAQPAPVARPSVVLPQVVSVVTGSGSGHHHSGGYGYYGWNCPRPVGVPVPIGRYYGESHSLHQLQRFYGWHRPFGCR